MKVTIEPSGVTAKDDSGFIYKIKALVIKKRDGDDVVYFSNDRLFSIYCPAGTEHQAEVIPDGKINIIA